VSSRRLSRHLQQVKAGFTSVFANNRDIRRDRVGGTRASG